MRPKDGKRYTYGHFIPSPEEVVKAKDREKVLKKPAAAQVKARRESEDKPAFFYGWAGEHGSAWRTRADGKGTPEYTKQLFAPKGANPTSPMWAKWDDGDEHMISDLLVCTYQSMQNTDKEMAKRGRGGKGKYTYIWSGVHSTFGAKLRVARRTDRQELCSLFEGKKQILQVCI